MGIRILVVEDEAKIAKFLIRGLREEGYLVEHASDGLSAWHELRSGEWDLVLLDWWPTATSRSTSPRAAPRGRGSPSTSRRRSSPC